MSSPWYVIKGDDQRNFILQLKSLRLCLILVSYLRAKIIRMENSVNCPKDNLTFIEFLFFISGYIFVLSLQSAVCVVELRELNLIFLISIISVCEHMSSFSKHQHAVILITRMTSGVPWTKHQFPLYFTPATWYSLTDSPHLTLTTTFTLNSIT